MTRSHRANSRIRLGYCVFLLLPSLVLAQHHKHMDQHSAPHSDDEHEQQQQQEAKHLPLCPVMGDPIDFGIKTMTESGPVYFCCAKCIDKFKADPSKYVEGVAEQREVLQSLDRIQVRCPITGNPIDPKVYIEDSKGQRVYFCCAGCKPKYKSDPQSHAAQLEDSFTYQTRCPVMGGEIDPTVHADLPTGERIYYCCPGCHKKLMANPEKYARQLERQGITIDVEKLKKIQAEKDKNRP